MGDRRDVVGRPLQRGHRSRPRTVQDQTPPACAGLRASPRSVARGMGAQGVRANHRLARLPASEERWRRVGQAGARQNPDRRLCPKGPVRNLVPRFRPSGRSRDPFPVLSEDKLLEPEETLEEPWLLELPDGGRRSIEVRLYVLLTDGALPTHEHQEASEQRRGRCSAARIVRLRGRLAGSLPR